MARNAYSGDKRRREVAKKKKREGKLARKQNKDEVPGAEEDTSYLEYLHPGGVPEELLPQSEEEDSVDSEGEEEDADSDADSSK